ncbi:MAG: thymidine kinase [Terrestrivirus sp.]|uniref:Thymidine kinase n=1 Tax=Terrestrivirus sp. TaxID=2487775 RepID=A0A3G4ZNL9_9VIRU|nr:MAG: thymidine kinase [Terrestrivirus sp.]
MNELISLCDSVEKLTAFCDVCSDGTPALFSWNTTTNQAKIQIGIYYLPVCRKHLNELSSLNKVVESNNMNNDNILYCN